MINNDKMGYNPMIIVRRDLEWTESDEIEGITDGRWNTPGDEEYLATWQGRRAWEKRGWVYGKMLMGVGQQVD
jgi:hypothetical protein